MAPPTRHGSRLLCNCFMEMYAGLVGCLPGEKLKGGWILCVCAQTHGGWGGGGCDADPFERPWPWADGEAGSLRWARINSVCHVTLSKKALLTPPPPALILIFPPLPSSLPVCLLLTFLFFICIFYLFSTCPLFSWPFSGTPSTSCRLSLPHAPSSFPSLPTECLLLQALVCSLIHPFTHSFIHVYLIQPSF